MPFLLPLPVLQNIDGYVRTTGLKILRFYTCFSASKESKGIKTKHEKAFATAFVFWYVTPNNKTQKWGGQIVELEARRGLSLH